MSRAFIIFLANGDRHNVTAPTLRTALRRNGALESKSPIVAAVDAECLPSRPAGNSPFCAVMLSNPDFTPPEPP